MTSTWKAMVNAELDRRDADPSDPAWYGRARTELARRVGRGKSIISRLLQPSLPGKPEQTSSALVRPISEILGVPLPVLGTNTEIAELVSRLDDRGVELTLELLRRLVK
jgi:hypothetical protein